MYVHLEHETDLGILRYYPPEDRQCGGIQYTWPYTGPYPYGPYTARRRQKPGRWLRPGMARSQIGIPGDRPFLTSTLPADDMPDFQSRGLGNDWVIN